MHIYNYNLSCIDVCYVFEAAVDPRLKYCGPSGAEDHRLRTTATIAHKCY